jgi:FdhD protein
METHRTNRSETEVRVERFNGSRSAEWEESLAVEEPLEIRIVHGGGGARAQKSISVTMRTPGNDAELAVGFLLTEGVIHDAADIAGVRAGDAGGLNDSPIFAGREAPNLVTVELEPHVEVSVANLERNFYTTSSCGVCGKASLLALRAVCPPRIESSFSIGPEALHQLPERLRSAQGAFQRTGGLHAAALFRAEGTMDSIREDVGRHNAVDKLLGAAMLADRLPLRDRLLLLSGRASFELLQKALMGGIPMVAAVGAPSSLAVTVAREFDITLVGFLRENHFNVYHGAQRIRAAIGTQ